MNLIFGINTTRDISKLSQISLIQRLVKYPKILKISPRAYIFQRPFLRGLFLEGLIFGGAYLWRKICVSKSIGLAFQLEGNLQLLLCFSLYLRAISKYKPPGRLTFGGFLRYEFGGFIFGGAYTWRGLFLEFYGITLGITYTIIAAVNLHYLTNDLL